LLKLNDSHDLAVLELAMRGLGHIQYLAELALPTVGVITNIGPQHIGLLGSLDNVAEAKSELLRTLPPDGLAVLPADDRYFEFLRRIAPCRVVTFGGFEADYHVTEIATDDADRIHFSLTTKSGTNLKDVRLPIGGRFNAINAAAALAVAAELGVDLRQAARALEKAIIPEGRMRVTRNETRNITIIGDCYNAGPDSMRAALEALADYRGARRRVAFLGEMAELGDWSEREHRSIGSVASRYVDIAVGVGQQARWILEELNTTVTHHWCPNSREAAKCARTIVQPGDVVLVKGSRVAQMEKVVEALNNW
jgi:UDP-N-acetylmuramoyl-tripeptide--D-alanyl-D-alanine ligase